MPYGAVPFYLSLSQGLRQAAIPETDLYDRPIPRAFVLPNWARDFNSTTTKRNDNSAASVS